MPSGQLVHRDSMVVTEKSVYEDEWQAMTAGAGITHSEFNPSTTEPVHLLQIWLFPDKRGHTPGYQQQEFTRRRKSAARGRWWLRLTERMGRW